MPGRDKQRQCSPSRTFFGDGSVNWSRAHARTVTARAGAPMLRKSAVYFRKANNTAGGWREGVARRAASVSALARSGPVAGDGQRLAAPFLEPLDVC